MAKNKVFDWGLEAAYSVVVTNPAVPNSGDAVRFGTLTGVAVTKEGEGQDIATETTVDFGMAIWNLPVKAEAGAISVGDAVFYDDGISALSNDAVNGFFFGFALAAVSNGATTTIYVLHTPSPGAGTLGDGTITTAKLAALAVTAAKLTATLATGYIPLALPLAREIATNDIINAAGIGGILSLDSTPRLKRINGATDKKLMIEWVATNVDEIVFDFAYPPDLDDAAAVTVNVMAKMGGATDTPVLTISYFEGVGDTNAGGNSAALSATLAKKSVTIAAGDVGAAPTDASIGIVPGAHATDTVQILAAWIEYTRK